MWLCAGCGLAQLADETVVPEEVLGREPAALTEQRRAAIAAVAAAGVLPPGGGTAMEFPSPHGGTWLDGLAEHGFAAVPLGGTADVVVDGCFGVMHEPDQRAALRIRVDAVAPGGTLVLIFHSLAAIIEGGAVERAAPGPLRLLLDAGHGRHARRAGHDRHLRAPVPAVRGHGGADGLARRRARPDRA